MDLNPGSLIRDYEITSVISKAGMGEVYLATERLLNRTVVLKRLSRALTNQEGFSARFQNEARIQAQLAHPNIVGLLTFFEEGGEYFMVLEYAPGITLRQLIDSTGPIPEARALHIFRQIATALAHAHSNGIVHRDIKPSNIMVDTLHGDAVKVMDFGVALLMKADHLTRTGATVGTIYYMSPEQVNAVRDLDQRSDIYSAGVLLYEMLSGKLPYDVDTDSQFQIQSRILSVEVPDPRSLYPYISGSTVAMLQAMTRKDRSQRPADFLTLTSGNFGAATAGRPVAVPGSASPGANKPQARPPVEPAQTIQAAEPHPKASSGSNRTLLWVVIALLVIGLGTGATLLLTHKKKPEDRWLDAAKGLLSQVQDAAQSTDAGSAEPAVAPVAENGMLHVQGGTFMMGSNRNVDEQPIHSVTVSPFMMAQTEVTQAQWQAVMGSVPTKKRDASLPVWQVSWYDAIEYCNALSRREGLQPCYSGVGDDMVWDRNANANKMAHPVASLASNSLGLYDMSGNLWEWCWDWYDDGYYAGSPNRNPANDFTASKRVVRGGCWVDYATKSTVSVRSSLVPSTKGGYIGFRVCRNS